MTIRLPYVEDGIMGGGEPAQGQAKQLCGHLLFCCSCSAYGLFPFLSFSP